MTVASTKKMAALEKRVDHLEYQVRKVLKQLVKIKKDIQRNINMFDKMAKVFNRKPNKSRRDAAMWSEARRRAKEDFYDRGKKIGLMRRGTPFYKRTKEYYDQMMNGW